MKKKRTTSRDWWETGMTWGAIALILAFAVVFAEPLAYGLAFLLTAELL